MSDINDILVRPINPETTSDLEGVASVIDTAFVEGDSWFKKPDCYHRCPNTQSIADILNEPTSSFLLAENSTTGEIVGALRVDWNDTTKVGHFGMLGVPAANAGKGIGRKLVASMVEYLKEEKQQVKVSMPVVFTNNDRLVKWYEQQNFKCQGEKFPFPVPEIVLEEYKGTIEMIQMAREL
jgi:ribosomal protein S18 acetylase RimI-like enzyme